MTLWLIWAAAFAACLLANLAIIRTDLERISARRLQRRIRLAYASRRWLAWMTLVLLVRETIIELLKGA